MQAGGEEQHEQCEDTLGSGLGEERSEERHQLGRLGLLCGLNTHRGVLLALLGLNRNLDLVSEVSNVTA